MTNIDSLASRAALSFYGAMALGAGGWLMPWAAVALECTGAALLLARSTDRSDPGLARFCAAAFAAAACLLGHALSAPVAGSAAVGFAAAWLCRGSDAGDRWAAAPVLLIAILRLALTTTGGWHCEEAVASVQSRAASIVAGRDIDLGPTFAATRLALLEVLLLLCSTSCRPLVRILLALFGVVGAPLLVGLLAEPLGGFGSGGDDPRIRMLAAQLPWLATTVVYAFALAASRFARSCAGRGRIVLAALLLLTAIGVSMPALRATPREVRSVLLYEPGFQNWLAPDEHHLGRYSAGMLGTLPRFVEAAGADARLVGNLGDADLVGADALVLINQDAPLPAGAVERIEQFVKEGGYLVVIADHTFLHEDASGRPRIFANEPLRFTHMRFANDSADPLSPAFWASTRPWRLGQSLWPEPGNPSGISIGGAVHVAWPARPVVVGHHAYVDAGLPARDAERGFLGDLMWNPGERLGDIVLAAEEQVGAGRVMVVGDTTGITNLGRTFHWEWWSRCLRGVQHGRAPAYWCAALLTAAAVSVLAGLGGALAAATAIALAATPLARKRDADPLPGVDPVLVVEQATCPEGRAGGWEEDGYLSLLLTAYRAGHLPCVGDTREFAPLLDRAMAMVVAAPRADPGAAWVERVLAWVESGGHLFVGASHEDARNIAGLLVRIDAGVSACVLGPLRMRLDSSAVTLREPWALELRSTSWRPLLSAHGEVLAATRELGRGRVFLVGDSRFFRNESLESAERIDAENVRYLVGVLREGGGQ